MNTSVIHLFVTCENSSSERRFDPSISILNLKERLESITGIPSQYMELLLFDAKDNLVSNLSDDSKPLGYYSPTDYMRLQVNDKGPQKNLYNDVSQIEKFEITDAEYNKKQDSVRAFLLKNKLGKYSEEAKLERETKKNINLEMAAKIQVGDRCIVDSEEKKGTVRFVGELLGKTGPWIGVEYDLPVGKHDGTVEGHCYFKCNSKCGVIVKPERVTVGDFPEDDFGLDEL